MLVALSEWHYNHNWSLELPPGIRPPPPFLWDSFVPSTFKECLPQDPSYLQKGETDIK